MTIGSLQEEEEQALCLREVLRNGYIGHITFQQSSSLPMRGSAIAQLLSEAQVS